MRNFGVPLKFYNNLIKDLRSDYFGPIVVELMEHPRLLVC